MAADDRALMRRVARRDDGAFREIVARYQGRLFTAARRLLGNRADAEDVVQRAFLQLFRNAGSYNPRWQLSTWLYRILINACVDELRRRRGRGELPSPPAAPRPGENLGVRRALERVPTEARLLLTLRYVGGLSYAELARVRGLSINTVKSQLARGKAILRKALE